VSHINWAYAGQTTVTVILIAVALWLYVKGAVRVGRKLGEMSAYYRNPSERELMEREREALIIAEAISNNRKPRVHDAA
jgi:hypothetical protein